MVALNKTAGPAALFARSSSARSALAFSCRVRAAQYDPGAPASLGGCRRSELARQSPSARFGSILPFLDLIRAPARAFWTAERGMSRQVNLCFAVLGVRPKRQHVDLLTTKSDNPTTSKKHPLTITQMPSGYLPAKGPRKDPRLQPGCGLQQMPLHEIIIPVNMN